MGTDFSALVLGPCVAVFGWPALVTPLKSQPNAKPYSANGIWTITDIDIPLDDGEVMSNRTLKFGIRLSDFTVAPKQGDWITASVQYLPLTYWQGDFDPGSNIDLIVDDVRPDGQGGATLVLKRITKPGIVKRRDRDDDE
jgi:hypothetical protein